MNEKTREKVTKYLKGHQIDRSQKGEYTRIANLYGADPEAVRSIYRRLRAKGVVEPENYNPKLIRTRYKKGGINHWNEVSKAKEVSEDFDFISEPEESEAPSPIAHDVKDERILYFADQHFVHHDKEVISTILDEADRNKVDTIILGGDLIDFYQVSRFSKRPDKSKLVDEVESVIRFLEGLRTMFPEATIYSKQGNHEARLMKYIINSAPALFGLQSVELKNLLKYDDFGIIDVADKQVLKVGDLNVIHGHEVKLFPMGINVAKSMLDKMGANVIFGHFHRTQEWFHTNLNEKTIGAWAVGASSDLNPDYNTYGNNWNHGFAIIETRGDGTFTIQNKIVDRYLNIY